MQQVRMRLLHLMARPETSLTPEAPSCRYDVLIDGESKKSGSLFEDFEPPFNPPEEIDDPEETKPEDWVDTAK